MATRKKLEEPQTKEPPLHLKYRPKSLPHVRGQDAVVKSLKHALTMKSRPHCYLFTGPTGTGKTTLARITAEECGVDSNSITEVDAASKNGVDDMRTITQGLMYEGFGERPNKAILLNECQRLSAQAWDSLLTTTEEPPEHVYFIFTSSHPAKIPAAMITRCQVYHLKPLHRDDILDVLEQVRYAEGFDTKARVLDMIADACDGSMRAALTQLALVHNMEDLDDVADLLAQPLDDVEVVELCRMLVKGELSWQRLTDTLNGLGDSVTAETVRIIVCAYLTKCLMGARNDRTAQDLLRTLELFQQPFDSTTKLAPLLVAFGRVMFD